MKLSDKLIDILKQTRISIENNQFWFEAFEFEANYNKGIVFNTDAWISPNEEYWQITYTCNGDVFQLEKEDRIRVEEYICSYFESVTGISIN